MPLSHLRSNMQDKGVALCFNNQQDPNNYTTQFPRLQVKAGDKLVANYTENGHVTQDKLPPDNKPHPGNYSWFWTGIPFTGSTTDGSQLLLFDDLNNGNRLSGPSNFDDGRCAESDDNTMGRTGPTNCQSHFTIPAGTAPGIYALYWVWDFTKLTAVDPTYLELYTSCMDVEVVADDGTSPPSGSARAPPASSANAGSTPTTMVTVNGPPPTTDNSPPVVTKTRHHTHTVTESAGFAPAAKSPVGIVYTTVFTEKIVTVTRTIS